MAKPAEEYESAQFEASVKTPQFKSNLTRETEKTVREQRLPAIDQKYTIHRMNGDLNNPNHPATRQYHKDIGNAFVEEANKSLSRYDRCFGNKKSCC